jgi:hypothetical protein
VDGEIQVSFLSKLLGHDVPRFPCEMEVLYRDGSTGTHGFWAKDDKEALDLAKAFIVDRHFGSTPIQWQEIVIRMRETKEGT